MINIQLYIEQTDGQKDYSRVDLFDTESMTLISSIQDVKDVSKIFADYSRTFDIPANSTNNKLFKHFYNPDVDGYNGSTKKLAKIYLNHQPFREGYVYLKGVKMKNNKASRYTIIFYGGLITLKDLMRDDKLNSLTGFLATNLSSHTYDVSTVKTGFTDGLYNNSIIYPLITSEKRLYYDSATSSPNYDGNLYHNTSSPDADRGLAYTDLKPAIKVTDLIDAIESKYNLSFTGFFDTTPVSNLYMWLSRESGEIIDYKIDSDEEQTLIMTGLTTTSTDDYFTVTDDRWVFTQEEVRVFNIGRHYSEFNVTIQSGSFDTITLRVIDEITGEVVSELTESGTAGRTITLKNGYGKQYSPTVQSLPQDFKIRFEIQTTGGQASITSNIKLRKKTNKTFFDIETYTPFGGSTSNTIGTLSIEDHFPDMKTIDFLTGLFRMFNLTAYVEDPLEATPIIEVKALDDYYADAVNNMSGGTIDITDYVDVEAHNVDLARPFSSISFEYEETDIVLMNQHESSHNKIFGNSKFNAEKDYNFIGRDYKVKLPFSHFKYERLFDVGQTFTSRNANLTYIQWGYSAGGDFEHKDSTTEKNTPTGNYSPEKVKPLLFYGIQQTISDSKGINWISDTPSSNITQYWRPSNSNEEGTDDVAPSHNINFDSEFDEWQLKDYKNYDADGNVTDNTLFATYYEKYITSLYSDKKRIFKYKCFLPAKILTRYKLNDQIKIQDRVFRINSIKTNLSTGQTELELLNLVADLDVII